MNDRWADVRARLKPLYATPLDIERSREILKDADALLAVVPYATHHFGCPGGYKGKPDECICGLDEILAALPENLRKEKDSDT